MEAQCVRIADLICAGHGPQDIVNIIGCGKTLVDNIKTKLDNRESLARKPGSGGHNKKDVKAAVKTSIAENPGKSMRMIAQELDIHEKTIRVNVRELGLKSYVQRPRQLLSEHSKKTRVTRASFSSPG